MKKLTHKNRMNEITKKGGPKNTEPWEVIQNRRTSGDSDHPPTLTNQLKDIQRLYPGNKRVT